MIFLQPAWLLLGIPLLLLLLHSPLPSRRLQLFRILALLCLLLALSGFRLRLPSITGTVVALCDRSASMSGEALTRQREIVKLLQRNRHEGQKLRVVAFAEEAQTLLSNDEIPIGNSHGSRLDKALRLAETLIPQGEPGRILVLSDGKWTGETPQRTAATLAARNLPIDYRFFNSSARKDWLITAVQSPNQVALRDNFVVHAWLSSPEAGPVEYELRRDGTPIALGTCEAKAGLTRLSFRDQIKRPGPIVYTLQIKPAEGDSIPENNHAQFIVSASGELPILLVSENPDPSFPQLLADTGLACESRLPGSFAWNLPTLERYAAVIIENIPAAKIGESSLQLLTQWVENTGRGVMLTGGRSSFGNGGYFGSSLERILPVSLELRKEHRKFSLAMVVVLDRSGSMMAPAGNGKTKMDLANLGTAKALDLLSDLDEFGVIAVDSSPHRVLDLQPVKEARNARNKILQIESMGGGIFVEQGLLAAAKMIKDSECGQRHIILFADAADAEEPGAYQRFVPRFLSANITISVVALGRDTDPDAALLEEIAALGGGTAYFTDAANDLPSIFAQDTFEVARSAFIDTETKIELLPALKFLSDGQKWGEAPALGGYNLCYARPKAWIAARSIDDQKAPLISAWQAGAGRTLAYCGEVNGTFTGALGKWENYGNLLASMTRWTAGARQRLPDGVRATRELRDGVLIVNLFLDPDRQGESFRETPALTLLRQRPGQSVVTEKQTFKWLSPDHLEARISLVGREIVLPVPVFDGLAMQALSPTCLLYSPEYAPATAEQGLTILKNCARLTKGRELVKIDDLWKSLPRQERFFSLKILLLILAALFFLIEIFDRRIGLHFGWIKQKEEKEPEPREARTNTPKPSFLQRFLKTRTKRKTTEIPRENEAQTEATASAPTPAEKEEEKSGSTANALRQARERAKKRIRR